MWGKSQREADMSPLRLTARHKAVILEHSLLLKNPLGSNPDPVLSYDATLAGWALAPEWRDMETAGHLR